MEKKKSIQELAEFFDLMIELDVGATIPGLFDMSVKDLKTCFINYAETGSKSALKDYVFMFGDLKMINSYNFDLDDDYLKKVYDAIEDRMFWYYRSEELKKNIEERAIFLNNEYHYYRSKEMIRKQASRYTSDKKVRCAVFEIHGENCLCCGSSEDITLDHIIPVSKGGKNEIENMQVLCRSCNSIKNSRDISLKELKKIVG